MVGNHLSLACSADVTTCSFLFQCSLIQWQDTDVQRHTKKSLRGEIVRMRDFWVMKGKGDIGWAERTLGKAQ